jgi:hypothetical protein
VEHEADQSTRGRLARPVNSGCRRHQPPALLLSALAVKQSPTGPPKRHRKTRTLHVTLLRSRAEAEAGIVPDSCTHRETAGRSRNLSDELVAGYAAKAHVAPRQLKVRVAYARDQDLYQRFARTCFVRRFWQIIPKSQSGVDVVTTHR